MIAGTSSLSSPPPSPPPSSASKHHQPHTTQPTKSKFLVENYHNTEFPYSYGSRKTVYSFFPHLDRKNIDNTLLHSDSFTKYRQYRRPRQYLPIYVHSKRELFQLDIIYMDGAKKDNDGYKFLLSVIDCYTKLAWVFPMKKISASNVVHHLRKLFSNPNNLPKKLHTDRGVGKCKPPVSSAIVCIYVGRWGDIW